MVKAAIIQLDRHARGVHQEHLKQVQGGHGLLMEGDAQRLASPAHARPIGCQKCDVIYRSASVEFFNRPLSEVVAQSFGRAGIHSDQMHDSKLRLLIVGVQPNSREIERWTKADAKLQHVAVEAPRADRKSTRLNSSHQIISYAVFCLKKKTKTPSLCSISRRY